MATTTVTLTPATLQASVSNAAGATTRATRSMLGKHGGLLTAKITNGTAPTAQCVATVLIAHTSGATPTAAGEGADWKTFAVMGGGGTTASAITPMSMVIPPCCHVQIEFTGNTGNAVTVEAFITDYTNLDTV